MNFSEMIAPAAPVVFTTEQVREARASSIRLKRRLIEVLEEEAGLDPSAFTQALAATLQYQMLEMSELHQMTPAFEVLPYAEAVSYQCIALRDQDRRLFMVISDPFDMRIQGWAELRITEAFTWSLTHRNDVTAYLSRHEETLKAMDNLVAVEDMPVSAKSAGDELSFKTISEDTSPVVKLVNSTVYDALKIGASDIHLETGPTGLHIKYRIDGVLTSVSSVTGLTLAEQVISRIKVMSELDIAERRVPQDGRFKVTVRGHEVDFRVSIMPSIFGEDAVLRILDKQTLTDQLKGLSLAYLGFDTESILVVRRLASVPYGMFLVTGPTGSGKTTTLYAAISEINNGHDKIITIEDPVEYQLPGVVQIPVNEKKGLTFERGLRSILRHDPDKIMVGEIRDPETAQIAVQSALTGHLVFTTVHANNVFDVLGRFTHMGVDPYSFVSALNGVMAQRLVRVNCPHCSIDYTPDEQLLADSGIKRHVADAMTFRSGQGCGQCRGTGYKGRKAIGEILVMTDQTRELIISRTPTRLIREEAQRNGTRFLREIAVDMVRRGETTLQEINRVTFVV